MLIAVKAPGRLLDIPEEFTLTVLNRPEKHSVLGKAIRLVGCRLIALTSESLNPETCIQIDCEDAFLLGEILGCWQENGVTFAAIELRQVLGGLAELRSCWATGPIGARLLVPQRSSA